MSNYIIVYDEWNSAAKIRWLHDDISHDDQYLITTIISWNDWILEWMPPDLVGFFTPPRRRGCCIECPKYKGEYKKLVLIR